MQIMWKHLEQASFPLSEEEYLDKLDAVAYCLTAWKVGPPRWLPDCSPCLTD
jgi:hypothetical protein